MTQTDMDHYKMTAMKHVLNTFKDSHTTILQLIIHYVGRSHVKLTKQHEGLLILGNI